MNISDEQEHYLEGLGPSLVGARMEQVAAPAPAGGGPYDSHYAAQSPFLAAGNALEKKEAVKRAQHRLDLADAKSKQIILRGITTTGRIFRPSDWAERLAGLLSTFDEDNRIGYSPRVRPTTLDGMKSVIVSKHLKEVDERAYDFLLSFARENDLVIEDGDSPST